MCVCIYIHFNVTEVEISSMKNPSFHSNTIVLLIAHHSKIFGVVLIFIDAI